ncbi:hypothetical protein [Saccharolobus caldissimus]|nr:hypothetical protein [Saccharolobus caldissimus]
MGLWEEHLVSPSFKGLDVMDGSPFSSYGGSSGALYCPPDVVPNR